MDQNRPLTRRAYLGSVGGAIAVAGCAQKDNTGSRCEVTYMANGSITGTTTAEYLPGDEATYAGSMSGTTDEYQSYTSEIYWVPQSVTAFSDEWVAAAKTEPVAVFNQTDAKSYIYLNKDAEFISDYILYHERGHNLGFLHDGGGIMSYDAPDKYSSKVDTVTRDIISNSSGVNVFRWTEDRVKEYYNKWDMNEISDKTMNYAFNQCVEGNSDVVSSGTIMNNLNNIEDAPNLYSGGLYKDGNIGWKQ